MPRTLAGALRQALPAPAYSKLRHGYHAARRGYYLATGEGRGRLLPDFLIIGGAKCGTTSLFRWMGSHPFVVPASAKQVHFFEWNFYRGLGWYRSHFPPESDRDRFRHEHGRPFLTGEASPTYLSDFRAPARVAAVVPDVKLIVLLRDPVERAHSHFQMVRREGGEPLASFEEAAAAEAGRLAGEIERLKADDSYNSWAYRSWAYLDRSRYADHLERWLQLFPREQFLFLDADELRREPAAVLARVYDFLGLPPHELVDRTFHNVAPSYEPLAPTVRARFADQFREHNERLRRLTGLELRWEEKPDERTVGR